MMHFLQGDFTLNPAAVATVKLWGGVGDSKPRQFFTGQGALGLPTQLGEVPLMEAGTVEKEQEPCWVSRKVKNLIGTRMDSSTLLLLLKLPYLESSSKQQQTHILLSYYLLASCSNLLQQMYFPTLTDNPH